MINVQQITSTLSQLSDQALQQYAQMHQEDPYTFALAVGESTRRKDLRNAAGARPAEQGQGTVAEEALGEMAPAPQAGLMAAADQQLPQLQTFADGGATDPYALPELERDPRIAAMVAGRERAPTEEELRFFPGLWQKLLSAREELLFGDREKLDRQGLTGGPATGGALAEPAPQTNPNYGNEGARTPNWGPLSPAAAKPAAGLSGAADAVLPQRAPTARRDNAGPGGGSMSLSTSTRSGLAAGAAANGTGSGTDEMGLNFADMETASRKRVDALTAAQKAAGQKELADTQADQEKRGVYGKDRETRIKAEQDALGGQKEQAKKMALLQAGLAILSADPSKGAWSAIGTGALQGLGAYKGDVAELDKKRSALIDKLDQIDDLRRQEATADAKDLRAIKAKIAQAEVDGAKMMAEIGVKIDLDVKPKAQMEVFKEVQANRRSAQDNATRIATTKMTVGAARAGARNQQDEIIRNIMRDPAYAAAYGVYAGGKQKPVDLMDGFNDWVSKNPGAAMLPPQKQVQTYLAIKNSMGAAGRVQQTDAPAGPLMPR